MYLKIGNVQTLSHEKYAWRTSVISGLRHSSMFHGLYLRIEVEVLA